MRNPPGFVGALFDFSFTEFVTTKALRLLYGAAIGALTIGALVILAGSLKGPTLLTLGALVLVPLAFLAAVTLTRVWCELVIVAFRLADHAAETAEQTAAIAVNTSGQTLGSGPLVP